MVIPLMGVSAVDQLGKQFDDPELWENVCDGNLAAFDSVELIELGRQINDVGVCQNRS